MTTIDFHRQRAAPPLVLDRRAAFRAALSAFSRYRYKAVRRTSACR